MPGPLTPHQRSTLDFIGEFQRKRGYSPSLSDLAVAFGVRSKNAVAKVVNALVKAKVLEKDPKGRIKILELAESILKPLTLPLFGPIAAGIATDVEDQVQEQIRLDEFLVRSPATTFVLRVKGESMINAGIHEGDLVLVDKSKEPREGDIVVGVLDSEFTLKRLRKREGKYYLQAENPAYPELHPYGELKVAGVVVGLVRRC